MVNTYITLHKCPGFGLTELLSNKIDIVGLEIGCDVAATTEYLLETLPSLTLHSIDPYTQYMDWNGTIVPSRENDYQTAMNKLKKYGKRFFMHKKDSAICYDEFEDEFFDFIFVDGIHTYDGVMSDCMKYYSKVKPGGIFSGHDFSMIPDVNRAVNEFAALHGKKILNTEVDVWYWYK
jgi:hypothetical protein